MAALLGVEGDLKATLIALNRVADDFYGQNPDLERDPDAVAAIRQDAWRAAQVLTDLPAELLDLDGM